jgi:hypothetical protein
MCQTFNVVIIDPYRHSVELRRLHSATQQEVHKEIKSLFGRYWVDFFMRFENFDFLAANLFMNSKRSSPSYIIKRIRGKAIIVGLGRTFEFANPATTLDDLAWKIHFCHPKRSKLRSILSGQVNSFYIPEVRYLQDADV